MLAWETLGWILWLATESAACIAGEGKINGELFRNANIDWLGKKWYFLSFSLLFSVAGVLSMLFWHGIPRGVDFKGGTQITFEFASTPNEDHIRAALDAAHIRDAKIQRIS